MELADTTMDGLTFIKVHTFNCGKRKYLILMAKSMNVKYFINSIPNDRLPCAKSENYYNNKKIRWKSVIRTVL